MRRICRGSGQRDVGSRTLHLLDIENLACDGLLTVEVMSERLHGWRVASGWRRDDLAVLAVNRTALAIVAFAVPDDIRVVGAGAGKDAADRALLAEAPPAWVADRFDRLVVASGDGIFADLAGAVCALGCEVWVVVSAECGLSRRLAAAADRVVVFDDERVAA